MKPRHRARHPARWWAGTLFLTAIPICLSAFEAEAQLRPKTFTVQPCRILDTRLATPPGPLPANTIRKIWVTGNLSSRNQGGAVDCTIPAPSICTAFFGCTPGTVGFHANVVAVGAEGAGHLSVFPEHRPSPGTSTLNFSAGQTVANGVLVLICLPHDFLIPCGSDLDVQMGPAAAHVVIDITGYVAFVLLGGPSTTELRHRREVMR